MKLKHLIAATIFVTSLAVCFAVVPNKNNVQVEAIGNYDTDASTYYNGITATSGKQLAAQLHDLITSTHRYYTSYNDNGSNLYQQYTDQYYENSSKVNGYIYEFYSGVKWPNGWAATAGNTSGGYNREHCWCQSNSVTSSGTQMWGTTGGGSDMHHIRPVECRLNSSRNNHPYGEVANRDSKKTYAKLGTNSTYALGGYVDNSADIFEPLDSKKGDVARIILYTYLHYNSYTVSDLFGSYGTTNGSGSSSYFATSLLSLTKTTSQTTEAKALEMLLSWNASDPVDDIERRRNEQVAVYQGNRNPFIDNSNYADAIWGNSTGITSISKTNASLITGETTNIKAVSSNGTNITWTTSNSSVCSISSGSSASNTDIVLTASGVGTATITAKVTISGTTYSRTCEVTVTAPKTLSSITVSDPKTSFVQNSEFEFNGIVTANYEDGTLADVTSKCTFTGYNLANLGNQTVTVSYTEGSRTRTDTYSITVNDEIVPEGDASLYGGSITEGYYVIYYNGKALKNTVSSNRFTYTEVTPTNNIISSPDSSIIWHIEPSGNYWTLHNSTVKKYAGSTSSKNQGVLLDSITDNAKWTVIGDSTYDFENLARSTGSDSGNKWLRNNGTYGFACYSASIGGALSLYRINERGAPTLTSITIDTTEVQKTFTIGDVFNYDHLVVTAHYSDDSYEELDSFDVSTPDLSTTGNKTVTVNYESQSTTYEITVNAQAPISISATASKTFYVGEVITKSDISVEDNLGNEIDAFTFLNNNYQFTYSDASSGGSLTSKTFTNSISYSSFTCSLTVQVQRKARVAPSTEDKSITYTDLPTSYQTSTTERTAKSGVKFIAYNCANYSSKMQFKASGGYIQTTESMQLKTVTINNRETNTLTVYGSTNGTSFKDSITGTNDVYDLTGYSYFKIMKNGSGAAYCASVTITIGESDSAVNLSNYIMYEDTNNQCTSKFTTAKGYFEGLTSEERTTFMTSSDYVICTARERLEAWARHEGKIINYANGDYSISNISRIPAILNNSINNTTIIVIVTIGIAVIAIGGYFLLRKKKEN